MVVAYNIVDIFVKEVRDWDGLEFTEHEVAKTIKEALEKELEDPKNWINIKDLY